MYSFLETVILRIQWLSLFCMHIWNFETLTLKLRVNKKKVHMYRLQKSCIFRWKNKHIIVMGRREFSNKINTIIEHKF